MEIFLEPVPIAAAHGFLVNFAAVRVIKRAFVTGLDAQRSFVLDKTVIKCYNIKYD